MARRFEKTYVAIVAPGAPEPSTGEVALPLRREEAGREAYTRVCPPDHPDAQPALTRYRTLAATGIAALVEARPETGRMHQIRVHLASGLGCPIAGDVRYGGALLLAGAPVPRLMLHAAALTFPHPGGGMFTVQAPPPPDFAGLSARLALG